MLVTKKEKVRSILTFLHNSRYLILFIKKRIYWNESLSSGELE